MQGRSADQYKQMQIKTASPGKLLLMLYQGAVKFMKLAKKNIKEGKIEESHKNIIKAQNIILELQSTLNKEQGGQIAVQLESLYDFIYRELIQANLNKNTKHLDNVIPLVEELFVTYKEIIINQNSGEEKRVNVGV
ncbi:flagellar export chaperone FliS [Halanaerobium saccharolyticum]|jgi:flagellar protein FliS|uniref:Flagellar secretion chaperone FliS n=1 Tax=Halanaerobium saccharolyticum TaxID=43595 RepID=A0A2T5RKI4_9FIRM|nr:flagellar export chaperone FliS [Halanaerobium saccharolyticum]OEG62954.1 MAG: flagellar export chaperone FliS [Halanaerobium sp. MDAL1]PTV99522.1 flagellar protein FliS [Halanaerobium saccharolyticum]TDP89271.1 flagellar protein FliS [Halanaerobium saccharolyticum]